MIAPQGYKNRSKAVSASVPKRSIKIERFSATQKRLMLTVGIAVLVVFAVVVAWRSVSDSPKQSSAKERKSGRIASAETSSITGKKTVSVIDAPRQVNEEGNTRTLKNAPIPSSNTNKVSYSAEDMVQQSLAMGRRQIFKYQSDIWFSQFIVPGVRIPPIPINGSLKDSYIESLTDPIEFSDDDTESERAEKEEVISIRKQAAEWIKNGGTFESFMDALETRQRKEADRVEIAREVLVNNFRDEEDPQATIDLWKAINKKMVEDGLRPMSLPAPIRIRLAREGIKVKE